MNVLSRAHRTLSALASFRGLSENYELPVGMPQLPKLLPGEVPIGIYLNDAATFTDLVFFSSEGVCVFRSGHWEQVKFSEITRTVAPDSKEKVAGFNLQLRNGESFWLPITGNKAGRFFDAFEVIRFFDRVLADLVATK